MDSNFQYAEAVKLVVTPFCVGCLGRGGVPRFSSFFMSGKPFDGSYDIDRLTPLALIAAARRG